MRLESVFHFSFYFTLALASACLALPTTFFLSWMPVFFAGMMVVFALAWRREGVWVLSETAANHLGALIAVAAVGWIVWQMPRSENDLIAGGVNWPAGLLPHVGPLLMILLAVKLFRPKTLPDWWVLQTMGLMMVTLAAILADDQWFAPLLALYLASFLWCMALYYPVRERALAESSAGASKLPLFRAAPTSTPVPWRWGGLPRVAWWTSAVGAASFGLFLIAPRHGQSQWNARQLSALSPTTTRIGLEPGIDLNRTGTVELSDEPAFSVTVRDHAGRLQDPAHIRRWRQEVLEVYKFGRWHTLSQALELQLGEVSEPAPKPRLSAPPKLAPDQWLVEFHVKPRDAGGLVLAEPVDFILPVGFDSRMEERPYAGSFFSPVPGHDSYWIDVQGARRIHNYGQVIHVPNNDRWQPAPLISSKYARDLAQQKPPKGSLTDWTNALVDGLPALQGAAKAMLKQNQRLPDHLHSQVAEEFCRYLRDSGEYRYSLDLRRKKHGLDPTEDFLVNVKEGHCERFAGGLALMLRAVGIRCRVVRGYLGVETDEHGEGVVRKSSAHSWVQALVPDREADTWQWLTLDPTPAAADPDGALESWLRWCLENFLDLRTAWKQLIMEYTPEQQANVLDRALRAIVSKQGVFTCAAIVMAVATVRGGKRFSRRWSWAKLWKSKPVEAGPRPAPFFAALVRLLDRHGIGRPAPGQTPREYAAAATVELQNRPATRDLAQAPAQIVACLYRVRFGGQPFTRSEQVEIEQVLQSLQARLSM